jgi:diguanylate cyclase (GGDEF)-like protein
VIARRFGEEARVWALTVVLAGAAAALWWGLRALPHADHAGIHLRWWMLAGGFALTELCVVHIHFRRGAHTLALGEIPLVLGLLFAAPSDVVVAWVAGAGLVLALQRDHPRMRLAFNLAQFGLTAGVAALVFNTLAPLSGELGPATWAAAGAAALASDALASLLVAAAMSLSGERVTPANLLRAVASGSCVAATNTSLAIAIAVVLAADPRAAAFLLVPVGAIFLAYRAYMAERNKHTRLEFLYDATRALTHAEAAESGLAGLLSRSMQTFRAEIADASMFPAEDTEASVDVALGPGERVVVRHDEPDGAGAALESLVAGSPAARVVHTAELDGPAAAHFRARGIEHAMVAALPGDRRTLGALVVANRLGVAGGFSADELRLFETLAHHTGATLERHRLGRTVSSLRDIQRHLEHQAFHDPLTGLANRLLFQDRIRHALSRRSGSVAIIYIDLDDFKSINDTLGHEAGDDLLRETAARLLRTLRPADTPARLGGDEFAVLLIDINEEQTRIVAQRILAALAAPFGLAGRELPVHASLGAALSDSGAMTAEQLVRNADTAMYVSKHGGKRGYSIYQEGMESEPVAAAA